MRAKEPFYQRLKSLLKWKIGTAVTLSLALAVVITWTMPKASSNGQLSLAAGQLPLANSLPDLSGRVRELFRLSGMSVDASLVSQETVEVVGFFDDMKAVEGLIHSRAMRDIEGLKHVSVVNKVLSVNEANLKDAGSEIVLLSYGQDPYIVTRNNTLYYLGALLGNGSRIIEVSDARVIVERSDGHRNTINIGDALF